MLNFWELKQKKICFCIFCRTVIFWFLFNIVELRSIFLICLIINFNLHSITNIFSKKVRFTTKYYVFWPANRCFTEKIHISSRIILEILSSHGGLVCKGASFSFSRDSRPEQAVDWIPSSMVYKSFRSKDCCIFIWMQNTGQL